MRVATLMLWLGACGSAEIEVQPSTIDWGEVDFAQPRPDDGYDAREVTLRNVGSRPLDVELRGVDRTRIVIGGRFDDRDRLPTLEPDQSFILTVGVYAYVPGEWTELVEGAFQVHAPQLRDSIPVEWSFTPVRNQ